MIVFEGGITREVSSKTRAFMKKKGLKTIALCRRCKKEKNFEHTAFMELSKGCMGHPGYPGYVGLCWDCIERSSIKKAQEPEKVVNLYEI